MQEHILTKMVAFCGLNPLASDDGIATTFFQYLGMDLLKQKHYLNVLNTLKNFRKNIIQKMRVFRKKKEEE